MRQLTTDRLTTLRSSRQPPCISLYQPTHRSHPANQQDPIRYRNLERSMETSLREKYAQRDVRNLLKRFRSLERDGQFWNHRTDGLAIMGSADTFELFELQRPVQELLVVANNFYTKPLLRILQSADRYQILCLSRSEARLCEANRDALDPVDLTDIPSTLTEALGEVTSAPQVTVRSTPSGGSVYYGLGSGPDQTDLDRDRFFRVIDRAILENYSRPSGLPLMLAALTENQAPFRAISHNPFLMPEAIHVNPDALDADHLRKLAWQQIEPAYLARLAKLVDRYNAGLSKQLASDQVAQISHSTITGRVATLLVEADRQLPGRLDDTTGQVEPADPADPTVGDVFNDLAEMALRMNGEVVVVPAERMPTRSGIAALYRY
jgi:Bacterial archaeo-eukaryotic release factor family 3